MKAKKNRKKLDLKKSTIARLDRDQLKIVQGAGLTIVSCDPRQCVYTW